MTHVWPVCEFVGCACAWLVTPYKLRIVNNWPAVTYDREECHACDVSDMLYVVEQITQLGKP